MAFNKIKNFLSLENAKYTFFGSCTGNNKWVITVCKDDQAVILKSHSYFLTFYLVYLKIFCNMHVLNLYQMFVFVKASSLEELSMKPSQKQIQ